MQYKHVTCKRCKGKGSILSVERLECPRCDGKGYVLVRKAPRNREKNNKTIDSVCSRLDRVIHDLGEIHLALSLMKKGEK